MKIHSTQIELQHFDQPSGVQSKISHDSKIVPRDESSKLKSAVTLKEKMMTFFRFLREKISSFARMIFGPCLGSHTKGRGKVQNNNYTSYSLAYKKTLARKTFRLKYLLII